MEKYSCLYDTSLAQYNSRDEQDNAWDCVAEKFHSTGRCFVTYFLFIQENIMEFPEKNYQVIPFKKLSLSGNTIKKYFVVIQVKF